MHRLALLVSVAAVFSCASSQQERNNDSLLGVVGGCKDKDCGVRSSRELRDNVGGVGNGLRDEIGGVGHRVRVGLAKKRISRMKDALACFVGMNKLACLADKAEAFLSATARETLGKPIANLIASIKG